MHQFLESKSAAGIDFTYNLWLWMKFRFKILFINHDIWMFRGETVKN